MLVFPSRWRGRGMSGTIRDARLILVLKPDEIGDFILATGFLKSLRKQNPQARIVVAVRGLCADLAKDQPYIDEVLLWNDGWRGVAIGPGALFNLVRSALHRWRNERPDWVVIPRGCGDHINASLYGWWTGAANICAHESFCADWGPDRLSLVNHPVPTGMHGHELQFHSRMLIELGLESGDVAPSLTISPEGEREVNNLPDAPDIEPPAVALGVGAGCPDKRWPIGEFRALVRRMLNRWPGIKLVVIGGPGDNEAGELIRSECPHRIINVAGCLSLAGTASLLRRCGVYVGNDTGPMHLAAAMGCAVVGICKHPKGGDDSSHYSPARFGPVAVWSRVLQPESLEPGCARECTKPFAHCVTKIKVEDVFEAVCEALEHARKAVSRQAV